MWFNGQLYFDRLKLLQFEFHVFELFLCFFNLGQQFFFVFDSLLPQGILFLKVLHKLGELRITGTTLDVIC